MKRTCGARLVGHYRRYTELLDSIGLEVTPSVLAEHLAGGAPGDKERITGILGAANAPPPHHGVPARVAGRMEDLYRKLVDHLVGICVDADMVGASDLSADNLREHLDVLDEADRDTVADTVECNGHRAFLESRYITVGQFMELLGERKGAGEPDPDRLGRYLRKEFENRGYDMSEKSVRALLAGESSEGRVPYCARRIMCGAGEALAGGLIALEDLVGDRAPDDWLEQARIELKFRSHSAMHKAIADATSLKYDCVHKALSGRKKAKRIQAEIKHCLDGWLAAVREGRDLDISDHYRAVPVAETCALLPELERWFRTKEDIYRTIAEKTGTKSGSVRRYFQDCGQLKYAPLTVYHCAKDLASGKLAAAPPVRRAERRAHTSYLADGGTRMAALRLAARTREALERWRSSGDDTDLEVAFRELRLALIITMKEQRCTARAAV